MSCGLHRIFLDHLICIYKYLTSLGLDSFKLFNKDLTFLCVLINNGFFIIIASENKVRQTFFLMINSNFI